ELRVLALEKPCRVRARFIGALAANESADALGLLKRDATVLESAASELAWLRQPRALGDRAIDQIADQPRNSLNVQLNDVFAREAVRRGHAVRVRRHGMAAPDDTAFHAAPASIFAGERSFIF